MTQTSLNANSRQSMIQVKSSNEYRTLEPPVVAETPLTMHIAPAAAQI